MKNTLVLPLLSSGVLIGVVCTAGTQKIHKGITGKKRAQLISEQEAIIAEGYLRKELSDAVEMIANDKSETKIIVS